MQDEPLDRSGVIELLNKCWMTHDGMWFYHCLRELGMEQANRLNKMAIRSLAPLEVGRLKKVIGFQKERCESLDEVKSFFESTSEFMIPEFMGAKLTFPGVDTLHWDFGPGRCFAYKGMTRIGAIEGYECGVIYRVSCWIDALGIPHTISPPLGRCLMLVNGYCSGDILLHFSGNLNA